MRILPVNTNVYANKHKFNYSANIRPSSSYGKTPVSDFFPCYTTFLGYNVHILDGGTHAKNIEHFAKSLSPDMDVTVHQVDTNPKSQNVKQMKSLLEELRKIPSKTDEKEEYIALPGLFDVSLQNIEAQYKDVMGDSIKLTPQNVKAGKTKLLEFLKKLSEHPDKYSKYIEAMDRIEQGIEYVYPVIQEINRLSKSGYKVYIPAGHPEFQTLKWLADKEGKKAELQHYIATGVDKNGDVARMRKYIQDKGWYALNLLNLSDAHIVNVEDVSGKKDYIYAAYDSTITDRARGVYNFYPVRDEHGNLKGYSYSNRSSVDYPTDEFTPYGRLENLLRFVGKNYKDVLASENDTERFKEIYKISPEKAEKEFANMLFNVNDIFTPGQIESEKIGLKGRYIDSSLGLFFDINTSTGEIIFPNCDCEGSGRPSVVSMWGSCFAAINAIKEDINIHKKQESK